MRTFILGVIVGTFLTAMGVHAAGSERLGAKDPRRLLNDEQERQFQPQLEQMRKQTELEQARMQGRENPCS